MTCLWSDLLSLLGLRIDARRHLRWADAPPAEASVRKPPAAALAQMSPASPAPRCCMGIGDGEPHSQ